MDLTPENKKIIDDQSYESLLRSWRYAPSGDTRFQGATGKYWGERMKELRSLPGGDAENTRASKAIG